MLVDFDTVKLLTDAIEQDARRSAQSKYTFDYFCKEHQLYNEGTDKRLRDDIFINCIFHNDSDPSLAINEEKRIWHCLGCNAGGRYLDLCYQYETQILGNEISYYHFLNQLLKDDLVLQQTLQKVSIFKKDVLSIDSLEELKQFKFHPGNSIPRNFLELASLLLRKECTNTDIEFTILSMQSGLPIDVIYRQIFHKGAIDVKPASNTEYDLTKMEVEDE